MLYSWMYVSRSLLREFEARDAISDIVELSQSRNASLSVTGALIIAGQRIAQLLEGERRDVLKIRASICRDPRHSNITTIPVTLRSARQFEGWSLLYSGNSSFMHGIIDPAALACPSQDRSFVEDLNDLFDSFAEKRA